MSRLPQRRRPAEDRRCRNAASCTGCASIKAGLICRPAGRPAPTRGLYPLLGLRSGPSTRVLAPAPGFAAVLRRGGPVNLNIEESRRAPEGLIVSIPSGKPDQEVQGHHVAVPPGSRLRPVQTAMDRLAAVRIANGPVSRTDAKGGRIGAAPLGDFAVALIVAREPQRPGSVKRREMAGGPPEPPPSMSGGMPGP